MTPGVPGALEPRMYLCSRYFLVIIQNDLVMKIRISSTIFNLNLSFASVTKSALKAHFPNSIIFGKQKV